MPALHKRITDLEERRVVQDFLQLGRELKGRTYLELVFFSVHGFLPEHAAEQLPRKQDFTVGGIRTVITAEKA
jgi:hypothetical protein